MTTEIEVGSVWTYGDGTIAVMAVAHGGVMYRWDDNTFGADSVNDFLDSFTPKPRTITVNGVELPEPLREAPAMDEWYWIMAITEERGVFQCRWTGLPIDLRNLIRGNAFRTEADARAWFDFEVKQRGGEV